MLSVPVVVQIDFEDRFDEMSDLLIASNLMYPFHSLSISVAWESAILVNLLAFLVALIQLHLPVAQIQAVLY